MLLTIYSLFVFITDVPDGDNQGPKTNCGVFELTAAFVPNWPMPPSPNEYKRPFDGTSVKVCLLKNYRIF